MDSYRRIIIFRNLNNFLNSLEQVILIWKQRPHGKAIADKPPL